MTRSWRRCVGGGGGVGWGEPCMPAWVELADAALVPAMGMEARPCLAAAPTAPALPRAASARRPRRLWRATGRGTRCSVPSRCARAAVVLACVRVGVWARDLAAAVAVCPYWCARRLAPRLPASPPTHTRSLSPSARPPPCSTRSGRARRWLGCTAAAACRRRRSWAACTAWRTTTASCCSTATLWTGGWAGGRAGRQWSGRVRVHA